MNIGGVFQSLTFCSVHLHDCLWMINQDRSTAIITASVLLSALLSALLAALLSALLAVLLSALLDVFFFACEDVACEAVLDEGAGSGIPQPPNSMAAAINTVKSSVINDFRFICFSSKYYRMISLYPHFLQIRHLSSL